MGLTGMETRNMLDEFLDQINQRFSEIQEQVDMLRGVEGAKYLKLSTDNVSNPPTAAELSAVFGTPATVGIGFVVIINDNGAGTDEYIVWSDGTNWLYAVGTVAV